MGWAAVSAILHCNLDCRVLCTSTGTIEPCCRFPIQREESRGHVQHLALPRQLTESWSLGPYKRRTRRKLFIGSKVFQ